jgi:hypothetical protein
VMIKPHYSNKPWDYVNVHGLPSISGVPEIGSGKAGMK